MSSFSRVSNSCKAIMSQPREIVTKSSMVDLAHTLPGLSVHMTPHDAPERLNSLLPKN